jgi:hypothetical protein
MRPVRHPVRTRPLTTTLGRDLQPGAHRRRRVLFPTGEMQTDAPPMQSRVIQRLDVIMAVSARHKDVRLSACALGSSSCARHMSATIRNRGCVVYRTDWQRKTPYVPDGRLARPTHQRRAR